MKTIYKPILKRLSNVSGIAFVDMNKGQLKKTGKDERPPLKYPAALISIDIPRSTDITDTIQDCKATVTVRLVFYPMDRTSADVPEEILDSNLESYEVIADVYAALQGFNTNDFDPLSRTAQGEESHDKLFVYKQTFSTSFEDMTADN